MNGVATLRVVLTGHSALTDVVPALRIAAGVLPLKTMLPAISITSVSSVDRNIPSPGATRHVTERVQVTVLGKTYRQVKEIVAQVRAAASANRFPTVGGITSVVVDTEAQGPDFMEEEASIYMQAQDFRVSFNEPR